MGWEMGDRFHDDNCPGDAGAPAITLWWNNGHVSFCTVTHLISLNAKAGYNAQYAVILLARGSGVKGADTTLPLELINKASYQAYLTGANLVFFV